MTILRLIVVDYTELSQLNLNKCLFFVVVLIDGRDGLHVIMSILSDPIGVGLCGALMFLAKVLPCSAHFFAFFRIF